MPTAAFGPPRSHDSTVVAEIPQQYSDLITRQRRKHLHQILTRAILQARV